MWQKTESWITKLNQSMISKYTHQLLGRMYLSVDRQVSTHNKLETAKNNDVCNDFVIIRKPCLNFNESTWWETHQQTCVILHNVYTSVLTSRVIYQKPLPEGDVDCTRISNSFTGQMKAHQELCAAANRNNNLGRRRGRVDLSAYFTVHRSPHTFITVVAVLPQDFLALFGQSDAEVCWYSATFGLPLESHSFLRCSVLQLTQCPPWLVDFICCIESSEEWAQIKKTTRMLSHNSTIKLSKQMWSQKKSGYNGTASSNKPKGD